MKSERDDMEEQKNAFKQDRRDKKDAFRQEMRTYRQGDRLGPRPVKPEFGKFTPTPVTPPVTPPITPPVTPPVTPPITPPVTPAPPPPGPFQPMKKGGKVKAKKYASGGSVKTSSASKRGDGCAVRGKTKGKMC